MEGEGTTKQSIQIKDKNEQSSSSSNSIESVSSHLASIDDGSRHSLISVIAEQRRLKMDRVQYNQVSKRQLVLASSDRLLFDTTEITAFSFLWKVLSVA